MNMIFQKLKAEDRLASEMDGQPFGEINEQLLGFIWVLLVLVIILAGMVLPGITWMKLRGTFGFFVALLFSLVVFFASSIFIVNVLKLKEETILGATSRSILSGASAAGIEVRQSKLTQSATPSGTPSRKI